MCWHSNKKTEKIDDKVENKLEGVETEENKDT
jgi:hypothetical protein